MQAVLAILNLAASVVLARGLGPESRGYYALLSLWLSITVYCALFGIHLSLARKVAVAGADIRRYYREAIATVLVMLVPAIFIFAIVAVCNMNFSQNPIPVSAWLVVSISLPFSAWNAIQMQMEIGRGRTSVYIASLWVSAAAQLAIVLVLWVNGRDSVTEYAIGLVSGSVLASVLSHIMITSSLPLSSGTAPRKILAILYSSRFDAMSTFILMAVSNVDRLFISTFFSASSFGIYVVALSVGQIQSMVSEAMALLFFGSAASSRGQESQHREFLINRLRQSVLVNALTLSVLIMVGPALIEFLYGEQYRSAKVLTYFLLPVIAIKATMRPFEEYLKGRSRALAQSMAHLVMLFVFFVLSLVFLHYNSVALTAVSLLLGSVAGFWILLLIVRRELDIQVSTLIFPKRSDLEFLASRITGLITGKNHG